MNPEISCPPRSVWQKMVGEDVEDFSLADVGSHLDSCPMCQATVESLMNGEHTWVAIAEELRQDLPPVPPVCQQTLEDLKEKATSAATHEEETLGFYDVDVSKESGPKSLKGYVRFLEKKARRELARKPYHRGKFPVDLCAGVIFTGGALGVLYYTFTSAEGLMSALINGILPAFILMLLAALCFIFWSK